MVGRGRGGRARREHDRVLPRARAALEARARRRHERPARRDRARRRAGNHRARDRRDAAALGDVARRRPRRRRPAHDADQQGLPRRARAEPLARPDGPQPGRGADQAGDGRRLRAGVRHLRRHEVAPQRAARVRPGRGAARGSSPTRAHPPDEVEAWRAAGVDVVVASIPARESRRRCGRATSGAPSETTRRAADGDVRRRRSRRPERPRRRRAVRRRAARRRPRCTGSRTCRCARAARSLGRPRASIATCSTVSRAAAREAGQVDSVAVDSWGVDFGADRPRRAARAEPRPLPRRAARARDGRRARARPRARALRAHGHPAHADQHGVRARRRWPPRATRRSTPPRRCS